MERCPAWRLAAHPVFLGQIRKLAAAHQPDTMQAQRARVQVLAMLRALCLHIIPADPMLAAFTLGNAAPQIAGHWRRACFGANRFMLLFRVDEAARIIVFGCVADLDASAQASGETRPAVLLGSVCPINAAGEIALPAAFKERLGVRAGSRITLRAGEPREPIAIAAADADGRDFAMLALRLWSAPGAAEQVAPRRASAKPGRRRVPPSVPARRQVGLRPGAEAGEILGPV